MTMHNSLYSTNKILGESKIEFNSKIEVSENFSRNQISIPVMQKKTKSIMRGRKPFLSN